MPDGLLISLLVARARQYGASSAAPRKIDDGVAAQAAASTRDDGDLVRHDLHSFAFHKVLHQSMGFERAVRFCILLQLLLNRSTCYDFRNAGLEYFLAPLPEVGSSYIFGRSWLRRKIYERPGNRFSWSAQIRRS
jgi:hypothetical protein